MSGTSPDSAERLHAEVFQLLADMQHSLTEMIDADDESGYHSDIESLFESNHDEITKSPEQPTRPANAVVQSMEYTDGTVDDEVIASPPRQRRAQEDTESLASGATSSEPKTPEHLTSSQLMHACGPGEIGDALDEVTSTPPPCAPDPEPETLEELVSQFIQTYREIGDALDEVINAPAPPGQQQQQASALPLPAPAAAAARAPAKSGKGHKRRRYLSVDLGWAIYASPHGLGPRDDVPERDVDLRDLEDLLVEDFLHFYPPYFGRMPDPAGEAVVRQRRFASRTARF